MFIRRLIVSLIEISISNKLHISRISNYAGSEFLQSRDSFFAGIELFSVIV